MRLGQSSGVGSKLGYPFTCSWGWKEKQNSHDNINN